MTTVISVGYEKRTVEDFIKVLCDNGVRRLLDVRELPLSRRKGFSKTSLAQLLADSGISYVHLRYAGNPHRDQKADINTCLELYGRHLDRAPDVVGRVADELQDGPVAVLCYERDHYCCHRSVLLERVMQSNPNIGVLEVS